MDFYFNRNGFDKKYKLLTYLVNTTNYLLLISGQRKAGKTTFINKWLKNDSELENNSLDNIITTKITLDFEQHIDLDAIKEQCVNNWQLNIDENFVVTFKDLISNIPTDTMYQYLLIIDNAERLPKNVLSELIKVNSEANSLVFRLILVGNHLLPDYASNVIKNKNYKIYNFDIEPLSFKETRLFLIEFYKKHNRTVPFNYKQVKELYKNSSGIIINIIREIRRYHAPQNKIKNTKKFNIDIFGVIIKLKEKISFDFFKEYKEVLRNISIASLGMVIVGLFIFQEEINQNLNDNTAMIEKDFKIATNVNSDIESDIQNNKIKLEEEQVEEQAEEQAEEHGKINFLKESYSSKKNKLQDIKNKKIKNTKDAPYILSLDNNNFTIQLGAYLDKSDAENFIRHNIRNNDLRKDFKIVAAKRNNKVYYLVLYGDFGSNKLADNYVKIMKQSLKDNGTWIRQIASVKKDIKNIG